MWVISYILPCIPGVSFVKVLSAIKASPRYLGSCLTLVIIVLKNSPSSLIAFPFSLIKVAAQS